MHASCLNYFGAADEETTGWNRVKEPSRVRGFSGSRFGPMLHSVANSAVNQLAQASNVTVDSSRLGIMLGTVFGDAESLDGTVQRAVAGRPPSPLAFVQSVPTAILGALCRDHEISGPIYCISSMAETFAEDLWASADLAIQSRAVDGLLLAAVELAPNVRTRATSRAVEWTEDAAIAAILVDRHCAYVDSGREPSTVLRLLNAAPHLTEFAAILSHTQAL